MPGCRETFYTALRYARLQRDLNLSYLLSMLAKNTYFLKSGAKPTHSHFVHQLKPASPLVSSIISPGQELTNQQIWASFYFPSDFQIHSLSFPSNSSPARWPSSVLTLYCWNACLRNHHVLPLHQPLPTLNVQLQGLEKTQWLGALAALPEDPSLVPSTHLRQLTTTWNFKSRVACACFWPSRHTHKPINKNNRL